MTRKTGAGIYFALLPSFALIFIFNYFPIFSALQHAFYRWDPGGVHEFIGLTNFYRLAQDPIFGKSLINTLIVILFNMSVKIIIPLIAAVMIFHVRRERARYFYRTMFIIPMVVPTMVIILIWNYIYSETGVISEFLRAAGLNGIVQPWLSSPQTALFAILMVGFPFVSGLALLIFYAGLMNIPESIFDAAKIEGVNSWQRFFRIELPLLLRQLKVILTLSIIWSIQGYELFLILTRGGPGYKTIVPGLWMYLNGFSFNEMGYACTIGFVMFLLMLSLTIINSRLIQPKH